MQVDKDAPKRKIVSAPVATPEPKNWKTVIPEGETAIQGSSLIAGRLGVLSLQDVASVVRLYSLDGQLERDVPMPGLGSASGLLGRYDRPELFYVYTSPLSPNTVYVYDSKTNASRPFNAPKLTFDPALFTTERVFFRSKDGTRVPLFVTHRKDMVKNGQNPTMLYAYGGFSISETPYFRPDVIAWVEQGGVYAVAHIRGGGEYGEAWHEAGMFEKKQNVFDDFIAAAEYLIAEKYTSARNLAINGGSNGGLLVGAVMTQRPELYGVAVPQVGVLDMLRYHHFSGGAAWATEYGAASDPKAFQYLRAYSPLQNIKPNVCYPATLVTTADHDDRVVPSHSFKFTAAMQEVQSAAPGCSRPVLIRVEAQGSHGYRPLDRRIAELADIWAFTAQHAGMTVKTPNVVQ
jgi:prolyl oligopeptidase